MHPLAQPLEVLAQEVVLAAGGDADVLADSVLALADAYLAVEQQFDGRADLDAANLELMKANKDSLKTVREYQTCRRFPRMRGGRSLCVLAFGSCLVLHFTGLTLCPPGFPPFAPLSLIHYLIPSLFLVPPYQVVDLNLAHRALKGRTAAVAAVLRAYDELVALGGA